jgi:hypothetical protein
LSREDPSTPEHAQFIAGVALQEVSTALSSGLYSRVSADQKIPAATVEAETVIQPTQGLGVFTVTVTDAVATKSTRLANAICDEYVRSVKNQRTTQTDAALKAVHDRINSIQGVVTRLAAIPASKLTLAERDTLLAQRQSLIFNTQLVANLSSYPPDDVAVLSHASGVEKRRTGNFSKKLILAGVSGVLACFLYILIGEVIAERRRAEAASMSS